MVIILNKDNSKDLKRSLQKKKSVKGFSAKKYNGILKLKEDPLKIQKRLRNEWK